MGGILFPPSPNWYGAHLCDFEAPAYAFCAHNAIVVVDSRRMDVTTILRGHGNRTTAVACVKSDSQPLWIVSAASDNTLRFWVCVDNTRLIFACRRALSKRPAEIKAITAVSNTDGIALFGDQAGNLFRCAVGVGAKLQKLEGCRQNSPVTCLAAVSITTSTGQECHAAVVACESGEFSLVNWKSSRVLSTLYSHTGEIHCVRWMSGLLLSSSVDKTLAIHKVSVVDEHPINDDTDGGKGQNVIWDELARILLPDPPDNFTASQKSRLWLTAEWFVGPLEAMTDSNGDSQLPHLWVLGSSYGGAILAWKILLPSSSDCEGEGRAEVESPIKLPATHSRTIFSIRCQCDTTLSGQPGIQILTSSMDRYVCSLWVPLSLVNALYKQGTPKAACRECPERLLELREEIAREKEVWQQLGPSAKKIAGLGGFAHDIALSRCLGGGTDNNSRIRMAIGCGDECIRLADVSFRVFEWPSEVSSPVIERREGSLLWQGIPSGVTCLAWHPVVKDVLAFGCTDGSVGLTQCVSGTLVLGTTRHKAPLTHVAWTSSCLFETDANIGGKNGFVLLTLSADGVFLQWPVWEDVEKLLPLPGTRYKAHHQPGAQQRQPYYTSNVLGNPRAFIDGSQVVAMVTTFGRNNLVAVALIDGRIALASKREDDQCITWRYDDSQRGKDMSPSCLLAFDSDGSVLAAVHHASLLLSIYWKPCKHGFVDLKAVSQLHCPALESATSLAVASADLDNGTIITAAVGFRDGSIQAFVWREGRNSSIFACRSRSIHGGAVLTMAWVPQYDKSNEKGAFLVSGSEDQSVQVHWDIGDTENIGEESMIADDNDKGLEMEIKEAEDVHLKEDPNLKPKDLDMSGVKVQAAPQLKGDGRKGTKLTLGSRALLPPLPARNTPQGQEILSKSIIELIHGVESSKVMDKDIAEKVFLNLGCLPPSTDLSGASLSGAADALKPRGHDGGGISQISQSSRMRHANEMRRLQAQRAAALELWNGDVGSAIATLLEYDALTADFVSMSASAGRQGWESVVRVYAAQLETKGEVHMSALQLLSIGDVETACDVYIRSGMVREAATLASARLPPDHPKTVATRSSYVAFLESRQEWECIAAHYVGLGQVDKAITLLKESGALPCMTNVDVPCHSDYSRGKEPVKIRKRYSIDFLLSLQDKVNMTRPLGSVPPSLRRT